MVINPYKHVFYTSGTQQRMFGSCFLLKKINENIIDYKRQISKIRLLNIHVLTEEKDIKEKDDTRKSQNKDIKITTCYFNAKRGKETMNGPTRVEHSKQEENNGKGGC